jgi:glycosyltransferase involved in cell wall biosynthesis
MNPANCRVILPGVSALPSRDRAAMRRELGLSDDYFAVLAPGESTRCARHSLALWTLSILHETDARWRMLVWGKGPLRGELCRLAARLKHPELLHTALKMKFEDVLPAADAAMITATGGAAILPVAMTMAAGLAIVATPREALADRRNALVIAGDSPRAAAQALLELRGDATLRSRLGDQAKVDAVERFSMERFIEEHRKIYSELM